MWRVASTLLHRQFPENQSKYNKNYKYEYDPQRLCVITKVSNSSTDFNPVFTFLVILLLVSHTC